MSFFDELKQNFTGAASAASKKTNELTGIAKLTVKIKSEEAKLSDCYKEIGCLFYTAERNGEDHTTDIAAYIMRADKIKANIAHYQAEIARLKKITTCENCGAELPMTSIFCSTCGTKLPKKEEPAKEEPCGCDCTCTCDCGDDKCDCTCDCGDDSCDCTCDCGDDSCGCDCDDCGKTNE